jgi:lysine-specific demethylase 3
MSTRRLNYPVFRCSWARSEPILVTDVHRNIQGEWGPEYFKNYYGLQSVTVIDCDTNEELKSTVADFFEIFGSLKPQRRILKIKACSFYVTVYPL